MIKDTADTTISVVSKIAGIIESAKGSTLTDVTRSTRVEPIVMMESRLRQEAAMTDVLQTLSSIFAGYYLQAVAVLTKVNGVEVVRTLDRLATERSPVDAIGAEAYKYALPNYDSKTVGQASVESLPSVEDRGLNELTTVTNLAVGKLFEVNVGTGDQKVTIPMSVRLNVKDINAQGLVHILAAGVKDNSAKERFYRWRAGELTFIKDLILCQDIIDARRQAMLEDKTDTLARIEKRRNKNRLSGILSGKASLNDASGIVVISSETAADVEKEIGGKLSKFKHREALFKNAFVMLMVVVDTEWERVTIYHRGIEDESELSYRDLQTANKRSGPDVVELLKAFQAGNTPRY
tara:strand:+ start:907 stop:1956 length:1050 start_codon:yes stop_codon:yes gene_type:complete